MYSNILKKARPLQFSSLYFILSLHLQMNASDLNVTCGENAVYVYDGSPDLLDMGSQSALSAVFCSEEALPSAIVESRTGISVTLFTSLALCTTTFCVNFRTINSAL